MFNVFQWLVIMLSVNRQYCNIICIIYLLWQVRNVFIPDFTIIFAVGKGVDKRVSLHRHNTYIFRICHNYLHGDQQSKSAASIVSWEARATLIYKARTDIHIKWRRWLQKFQIPNSYHLLRCERTSHSSYDCSRRGHITRQTATSTYYPITLPEPGL